MVLAIGGIVQTVSSGYFLYNYAIFAPYNETHELFWQRSTRDESDPYFDT